LPAIVISTECQTEKVCLIKMHNFWNNKGKPLIMLILNSVSLIIQVLFRYWLSRCLFNDVRYLHTYVELNGELFVCEEVEMPVNKLPCLVWRRVLYFPFRRLEMTNEALKVHLRRFVPIVTYYSLYQNFTHWYYPELDLKSPLLPRSKHTPSYS
jgi:hypothetical protein